MEHTAPQKHVAIPRPAGLLVGRLALGKAKSAAESPILRRTSLASAGLGRPRLSYWLDFFFLLGYIFIAMALSAYVHDMLRIPYYIFSTIMAVFLTSKSIYNKHRRNFVSIYFMLMRDVAVYRPFYRNND